MTKRQSQSYRSPSEIIVAAIEALEPRKLFAGASGLPDPIVIGDTGGVYAQTEVETVQTPVFSHQRGFYDSAFQLTLSTPTPDASIRYTLDGSTPSETHGTLYTSSPIDITTTTVVRSIAYKTDSIASVTMSHTYLFLADVIRQGATIPGQPNPVLPFLKGARPIDYEMDPDIVNSPTYKDRIIPALLSIPTLSISVPQDDMWGNGFYDTDDVEVAMSMEYINPADPSKNIQANAGIEAHGDDTHKRSLRVTFKKEYGEGKLDWTVFQNAPLNGDTAANEVDQFVLRAGSNRSWSATNYNSRTTFTEDEFGRSTQIALSGEGLHGTFVHLYLNGVYFGMYNMVERANEGFGEIYYGGKDDDWFSINADGGVKGDSARWWYMLKTVAPKDMSNPANYELLKSYLDVENFSDYLIEQFYHRVTDWPVKNWWAGGDTVKQTPFKFYAWDTEYQFNMIAGQQVSGAWVHPDFRPGATTNATKPLVLLWRSAMKSPDFRQTFIDRVSKAVAGALDDAAVLARLDTLNNFVSQAVIAESARWGDLVYPAQSPRNRDTDWVRTVNEVRSIIPGNAQRLLAALRAEGYYPSVEAPVLSQAGGVVDAGTIITLNNPNPTGTLYYTLDGSDPRLPGGGLNPVAVVYNPGDTITINAATQLRARINTAGDWSGIVSADFSISNIRNVRFSEIYYHPKPPADSSFDKDEYEYLELLNTGDTDVSLHGLAIGGGVNFTFGNINLPAGQRVVVVRNLLAFESAFGTGINVAGQYSGKLDNAGEQLTLTTPSGTVLADFVYSDDWYKNTDGDGYSLVVIDPLADPVTLNLAESWKSSLLIGGTPGASEPEGNQAPKISLPATQSITFGDLANLIGSITDDGLPVDAVVTSEWTLVSGPGEVTFGDALQPSTTASFSFLGSYVLRLTATDGELSSNKEITVEVNEPVVPGSLAGVVFDDTDGNGLQDTGELTMSGVTVYVDANLNNLLDAGELFVATGLDGAFYLADIAPGATPVRMVLPADYEQTTTPLNPVLENGQNLADLHLGLKKLPPPPPPPPLKGSIRGIVFGDANVNGLFDAGDSRTSDRVVFLDANGNDLLDPGESSTTTNAVGEFAFTDLPPGHYAVRRILPKGYTYSTLPINIDLSAGVDITVHMGSKKGSTPPPVPTTGSISGFLFSDANRNGIYNAGEGLIAERVAFIDLDNDGLRDSNEKYVTTDIQGRFTFTGLAAGTYNIKRVLPKGYAITTPPQIVTLAAGQVFSGVAVGSRST